MIDYLAVGLDEALEMTLARVSPLATEAVDLTESVDRVVSEDLMSRVDSPSVDASLKDGYAVISREVAQASADRPVRLALAGVMAAGGEKGYPGGAGNDSADPDRRENPQRC